ncbi:acyl-CoA dehydrogenase [Rhodococcus rhodnii]|uniref:Acyl CoA dehydrogenase n=2 Tax=Rhodococcus rhodnii TaxID=38312 RepID=R7WPU7_9NOCA|nr:acyl-CoA dehydrogenase family protein [Rhodococcus rhodnii]EOM77341.1 acyl CoA dehydrogenase [Rhodococcus rhodnii LMG 5362]TXG91716.1 acyl-CoA dehydrogenase [Rhodococcus rhodnii]
MDFELGDEQTLLRDTTRELLSRAYDPESRRRIVATDSGFDRDVWQRFAQTGLLELALSTGDGDEDGEEALGGPVEVGIVMTEIGRRLAPEPYLDAVVVPGGLVARVGTAEQRDEILPPVGGGERMLAFAHDEPGVRWPARVASTRARADGDGWAITGVKNPVPHGGSADTLVVSAVTDDGALGLFVVDGVAEGVTSSAYPTYDGLRAARIDFVDAPAVRLGDSDDDAWPAVVLTQAHAQAALCAEAVGAMDEALRSTVEYLKTRRQFGVPLAHFQALTHRAADMYVLVELARSMSLYATMSLAAPDVDPVEASAATSRAKLQICRSARQVGQEAIQLHGGIGMTDEYPVGHYTARLTAIARTLGDARDHVRLLSGSVRDTVSIH